MLESVLAILSSTPEKLRREIQDLSPRETKKRPRPDKWSVQQILAHLADVEQHGMRNRVEVIVTQDRPLLEPFDQEKRAVELRYDRIDPSKSLASLASQRKANLRWLRRLRPADLRRIGIHPQVGEVSVLNFLHEWAFHDLGHLRQIMDVKRYALFPQMGNTRKFYQFNP
jgi:DinB superfamily